MAESYKEVKACITKAIGSIFNCKKAVIVPNLV